MARRVSRRKFLGQGSVGLIAGGAALSGVPKLSAKSSASPAAVDYYQKLGVTPLINAAGTYTVLTASTMPDEVQAAVALAAKHPVNLNELQEAAGQYLAKRLRCEAALVTAGAAAALVVGTAACVTTGNDTAILNIPTDMAGLKNEVIIQKGHRYDYEHGIRNCGVRFVEVETLEQYEQAFSDRTVMAHFFNAGDGKISREDWVRVAHAHNVPCFNDAAADSTDLEFMELHADGIRSGDVFWRQGLAWPPMHGIVAGPQGSDRSCAQEQFAQLEYRWPRHEGCQRRDRRLGCGRGLVS